MKLNIKSNYILLFLLVICFSCSSRKDFNNSILDTNKVIEKSVEHIFKTKEFPEEYYIQSIKIFKSKYTPELLNFKINGRSIELISKPNEDSLYLNRDIFNPKLFIDVVKINRNSDQSINVELIFPSTGDLFNIKMKSENSIKWEIVNASEAKIKTEFNE